MAYHFVDEIFEKNMMDIRTNINIFMFINKISQTDIIKAMGYTKGTVSKAVSGDNPVSDEFVSKFCDLYCIPANIIEMKPIYFYSHICKEKRKQIIEETGNDPGELRDIELLKRYRYNPKIVQKEAPELPKNEVKEDFAINEVKQEVINKDKLYLAAKYKRKILRKESFTETPLMLLGSVLVVVIIYFILSFLSAEYIFALTTLSVLPIVAIALMISRKKKITVYVSAANDFSYEIDENVKAKPLKIAGIVEVSIFIVYFIIGILELIFVKMDSDNIWMKELYGIQLAIISIATLLSCSFNYYYPKKLTNKVLFYDRICAIGFYMQLASLSIFVVLMVLGIYGGIVLFLDIPLVISSLVVYIMSKFYLSKYRLYEYVLDEKIPFEENKNSI